MVFDGRELKGNLVPRNESTYDLIIDATPGTTNLVSKNLFANIDFNDAIASLSLERGGDNHNNIRAQ